MDTTLISGGVGYIKYINNYNIHYIIGNETNVPNCIKMKKVKNN